MNTRNDFVLDLQNLLTKYHATLSIEDVGGYNPLWRMIVNIPSIWLDNTTCLREECEINLGTKIGGHDI